MAKYINNKHIPYYNGRARFCTLHNFERIILSYKWEWKSKDNFVLQKFRLFRIFISIFNLQMPNINVWFDMAIATSAFVFEIRGFLFGSKLMELIRHLNIDFFRILLMKGLNWKLVSFCYEFLFFIALKG